MKSHPTYFLVLLTVVANASPRSSVNYTVPTDTSDSGGQRTTSAAYTHDGSLGGITGISSVASPSEIAKHGYLGQLTEVTALQLAATPATINETATRQLSASQLLDDNSVNALAATAVTWSVANGPLTGIDTNGLATAGIVYQNTAATAQGDYAGFTAALGLTVLNTIPDNFGTYAGDGLNDDWQFENFGLDNPDAGPLLDPDGDGQNNLFEFTAGLIPTNPLSRFLLKIEPVLGQPQQKNLVFEPLVAGRAYTVWRSTDLSPASWSPLPGSPPTSNVGSQRTVTDAAATETKYFYRIEIIKP
jgi:hypothetical protein